MLTRRRAAAVFVGSTPFRALEAAKLYHDGWMPEVRLTEGRLSARMGRPAQRVGAAFQ
jgi:hypothetical protein